MPDNGSATTITVTASAAPTAALTVNLTVPAASGLFASTTCGATITIAAGATTATCTATAATNTTPGDGPTNVNFAVAAGTGYTVGAPASAAVSFVNDDAAPGVPTVSIAAAPSSVPDNGSATTITVTASSAPTAALTVNLTVPAASGLFASTTCGPTISIAAGATTATCTATAATNTTPGDGPTNVNFAVAAGTGYTLGAPSSAAVSFINDDAAPTASAAAGAGTISEGNTATFVLNCTGTGTFAIPYTITGNVATDGAATPASPANVTCGTPLNVTVATQDNSIPADSRTLTLTLGALPAPLVLAGTGAAGVSVLDNDGPPPTVPTIGAFGMGLMTLLIAGFGALTQRRRKQ